MLLFWNLGEGGGKTYMQTSQCLSHRSLQERRGAWRPSWQHSDHVFFQLGLWQEVKDQQQHQQTQEALWLQASSEKELLQLFHVGQGGRRGKGRFFPAPGRVQIFSTIYLKIYYFFKISIIDYLLLFIMSGL